MWKKRPQKTLENRSSPADGHLQGPRHVREVVLDILAQPICQLNAANGGTLAGAKGSPANPQNGK